MKKLSDLQPVSFFTDFKLQFYCVRIFYLCRSVNSVNWNRNWNSEI